MKKLGYCMSGNGFLRAFCWLCRDGEAVQIGSSAGPDALARMENRLVDHMAEKHFIDAECFCGDCQEKISVSASR